ncbi:MAG: zf-HC2 domain-containing protein [Pseudomonadota bacterium]
MSCRETSRLLDAYVDGELGLPEALAVEDHVQGCPRCATALDKLRAVRAAVRGHTMLESAPRRLRERLHATFSRAVGGTGVSRGWALALASPGIAALALVLWLGFLGPAKKAPEARVVYHISSSAAPGAALRNVANHLNAAPNVKIVVVAHNEGVNFLLRGARDENGEPVEPAVKRFRERGVEFRVCFNTLERRRLGAAAVIPEARLVPSGIAEIGRLQAEEGYVYMRL